MAPGQYDTHTLFHCSWQLISREVRKHCERARRAASQWRRSEQIGKAKAKDVTRECRKAEYSNLFQVL